MYLPPKGHVWETPLTRKLLRTPGLEASPRRLPGNRMRWLVLTLACCRAAAVARQDPPTIVQVVPDVAAAARQSPLTMVQMEPDVATFGPLPSSEWLAGVPLAPHEDVELTFALAHSAAQLSDFEASFNAISDPRSMRYRRHLSIDDVRAALAPPAGVVDAVSALVERHNGTVVRVARDRTMVRARLRAADAEALLSTALRRHAHASSAQLSVVRAARAYFLPSDVASLVTFVGELLRFPRVPGAGRRARTTRNDAAATTSVAAAAVALDGGDDGDDPFQTCAPCPDSVTPAVLAQRYGFPPLAAAAEGNGMAVAEFQLQGTDAGDLANFSSACGVAHVAVDKVRQGDGGFVVEFETPRLGNEVVFRRSGGTRNPRAPSRPRDRARASRPGRRHRRLVRPGRRGATRRRVPRGRCRADPAHRVRAPLRSCRRHRPRTPRAATLHQQPITTMAMTMTMTSANLVTVSTHDDNADDDERRRFRPPRAPSWRAGTTRSATRCSIGSST